MKSKTVSGVTLAIVVGLGVANITHAAIPILSENFEDGVLDSRISVTTTGTFSSTPGIQPVSNFGSNRAFGFGETTCQGNCWLDNVTAFTISFNRAMFVSSIAFKEMELFDNWGSGGGIFVDGQPLTSNSDGTGPTEFGRLPYNDRQADTSFRSRRFLIGRNVTTIELRVVDITGSSEIFIDDLQVDTNELAEAKPVPALSTWGLMITAGMLLAVAVAMKTRRERL